MSEQEQRTSYETVPGKRTCVFFPGHRGTNNKTRKFLTVLFAGGKIQEHKSNRQQSAASCGYNQQVSHGI